MNNKLSKTIMFTVGAVIGSAVTYIVTKKKYDKLIQEEIDSVKESYSRIYSTRRKSKEPTAEEKETVTVDHKETISEEYENMVASEGYAATNEYYEKEEKNDMDDPYVISPDDFGETGYEKRFFTLYKDGVLEDDFGDVLDADDVEDFVGTANLARIGEYEDDILHVRSDIFETDSEITRDYRAFSEID